MATNLVQDLEKVVGARFVVSAPEALRTYDADGCVVDVHSPDLVVLPETSAQIETIVKLAARAGMPIVPRGAGTGLAGGATHPRRTRHSTVEWTRSSRCEQLGAVRPGR
jgi:glycolate oxidase